MHIYSLNQYFQLAENLHSRQQLTMHGDIFGCHRKEIGGEWYWQLMEARLLTAQSAKDKLCPYEEYLARYVNQVPSFAKIPFEN